MKKTFICISLIIFSFVTFNNAVLAADLHSVFCTKSHCKKCEIILRAIDYMSVMTNKILIISEYILLLILLEKIKQLLIDVKVNTLIKAKVQFNE